MSLACDKKEETTAIFRFKFTSYFQSILDNFAKLHRFDNRHDFKDAWNIWIDANSKSVDNECQILKDNGYIGSPQDKMYKSARYYFRKKNNNRAKPKTRRKYVSLKNNMIELMDNHIMESVRNPTFKPSMAFDIFCKEYSIEITHEITRLYSFENLSKDEISEKFKKTYKNRYFQKFKV